MNSERQHYLIMKPKVRLDKNAIQQFFIEHVEKIAFGLVVAGSL